MAKKSGKAGGSTMNIETTITADYKPSEDEPFMNERHQEYFRRKLND